MDVCVLVKLFQEYPDYILVLNQVQLFELVVVHLIPE